LIEINRSSRGLSINKDERDVVVGVCEMVERKLFSKLATAVCGMHLKKREEKEY